MWPFLVLVGTLYQLQLSDVRPVETAFLNESFTLSVSVSQC